MRRVARVLLALAIATALLNSTAASPLYGLYQELWHFKAVMLTAVYAAYSLGTLGSLLAMGVMSDRFRDRRTVIVPGLLAVFGGATMCAVAPSLPWLFAGRILAGIGTGAVTGPATAALEELEGLGRVRRAATIATVSFTGGCTIGPLLSAAALRFGLWPLQFPFLAIAVMALVTVAGLVACPWRDLARGPDPVKHPEPAPPRDRTFRKSFILACGGLVISWAVGATFMALGPSLTFDLLAIRNRSVAGLVPALFQLVAGAGQVGFGSLPARRSLTIGASTLALMMAVLTAAAFLTSTTVFVSALVGLGIAYGMCFTGSAVLLNLITPPGRRAFVVSSYYVVGYLGGNTLPVLVIGALADRTGLFAAMVALTSFVVVVGLFVVLGARRILNGRA